MKKKTILIIFALLSIIVFAGALYVYNIVSTSFNIDKTVYIYVDNKMDYNNLRKDLQTVAKIENIKAFDRVSSFLDYRSNMKVGKYAVAPDMNILELLKKLKNGRQTPVKLKFNNLRTKEDFAERISDQLIFDKATFLNVLNDSVKCAQWGFSEKTIVAMFIPNTYEFYWNTTIDNFLKKMNEEYHKFWNKGRVNKAEAVGLSPIEISILASIVEEECTYSDEYPIVAGLYLNRLRIGQALQADPTVKFAVGDFSLKRILNKHLQTISSYNTYLHAGLPPGPIRIPSIKAIDGVLGYTQHGYFYMCAKEDFSGRHNFAATFGEHQMNAAKYRKALNARGIYQ